MNTLQRHSVALFLAAATLLPVVAAGAARADDLVGQAFAWIDNGRRIGIITFGANGTAFDTWSPPPDTWRIDTNGDLLITNAGRNYVTRLSLDGAGGFRGQRDATSQVQDSVQTVLQRLPSQQGQLD
jgi:hypothetical protein